MLNFSWKKVQASALPLENYNLPLFYFGLNDIQCRKKRHGQTNVPLFSWTRRDCNLNLSRSCQRGRRYGPIYIPICSAVLRSCFSSLQPPTPTYPPDLPPPLRPPHQLNCIYGEYMSCWTGGLPPPPQVGIYDRLLFLHVAQRESGEEEVGGGGAAI